MTAFLCIETLSKLGSTEKDPLRKRCLGGRAQRMQEAKRGGDLDSTREAFKFLKEKVGR